MRLFGKKALSLFLTLCMIVGLFAGVSVGANALEDSDAFNIIIKYSDGTTATLDTWHWDEAGQTYKDNAGNVYDFIGTEPLYYASGCNGTSNYSAYVMATTGYAKIADMLSYYGLSEENVTGISAGNGTQDYVDVLTNNAQYFSPYMVYATALACAGDTDTPNNYMPEDVLEAPLVFAFLEHHGKVRNTVFNTESGDPVGEVLAALVENCAETTTMLYGCADDGTYTAYGTNMYGFGGSETDPPQLTITVDYASPAPATCTHANTTTSYEAGNSGTHTVTVTCDDCEETVSTGTESCEYTSVVTAPTCTTAGYTTYTCGKCGYSYQGDPTAALEHTVTAFTDNGNSTHSGVCDDCGETVTESCTYEGGVCTVCGAEQPTLEVTIPADTTAYTVSENGAYRLAEGAACDFTIAAGVTDVTIIGCGVKWNSTEADTDPETGFGDITSTANAIHIDCTAAPGVHLTIQDLYNSVRSCTSSVLNFAGEDNRLTLNGICVLDYDVGFTSANDANIHVGLGTELTIDGSGSAYLYNCTQGAGIGGVTREMNGEITFAMSGYLYIKGTKQGAVIGAGSGASSTTDMPGAITFESGVYNVVTVSRGAAIGGSAGSTGGSTGTSVYVKGGTISINTDYSGAAVGGGGYSEGNDSSGGTMYVSGGSLRPYVDKNASSNTTAGWNGKVLTEGVNDAVITANRLNGDGTAAVYMCAVDTVGIAANEGNYAVYVDSAENACYDGPLHTYSFAYDGVDRNITWNTTPLSTCGNWVSDSDTNLYLWLSGADHTLTINGTEVTYYWYADTETFGLEAPPEPTPIAQNVISSHGEGGSINAAESAVPGNEVTFTATPATGYYLAQASYTADGVETVLTAENGAYSFTMPEGEVSVNAYFISIVWDGALDLTWYDEDSYVLNAQSSYYMYYPAQWQGLAWICSEDLYFLTDASVDAATLAASGYTKAYQYNTNGNVTLVVGEIPTRSDLCTYKNTVDDSAYGNAGQNYFSGATFYIMNDMNFGGVGTDYFDTTTLVSLTSAYTGTADMYYSHMSGPNYYPVGSQAKNDGVYGSLNNSTATTTDYHFWGIFCGSVDGQGHLMDNIRCDRGDASNIGGSSGGSNYYQSTALIGRLGMPDSTDYTKADNDCIIKDIAVDGFIYGERSVGGIIGKTLHVNTGHKIYVDSCMNFATIWSTQSKGSGGIIGASWNGPVVTNCVNFGRCINGYTNGCGGVTGTTEAAFTNCYNVGMVSLRSGTPASFGSQNGGGTVSNCYALVGSTFSGNGSYSNAATPYLSYNLTGMLAINTLADVMDAGFIAQINGAGRDWTKVGTAATVITDAATLKSPALADALVTNVLFYSYDGTTALTQTGVANFPIPRAFTLDNATCTSVTFTSDPADLSYVSGQSFDTTGLVLTAGWSDGSTEFVTDYDVSIDRTLETSDTEITISGTYLGISFTKTYAITVEANALSSVSVTTQPANKLYAADETFDATGMVVKATYTNGTTETLSYDATGENGYTWSADYAAGIVTVSYAFEGVTKSAEVTITVLEGNAPEVTTIDGVEYYQIATANHMLWFANKVNTGAADANAIVTADIDLSDAAYTPVGNTSKKYIGTFDGNGHTITLGVTGTTYRGLFGYITTGAVVKNVTVAGSVSGSQYVAGVVAYVYGGTVDNCVNKASVTATGTYSGGIVGDMNNGTISNSINEGAIKGTQYVGGITGRYYGGTLTDCGNTGSVTGTVLNVGGVAGYALAYSSALTVSGCFNKGNVTTSGLNSSTSSGVGGLFGYVKSNSGKTVTITDCYNTGAVSGPYSLGGLIGYACGFVGYPLTVTNCYNAGTVTNTSAAGNTTYTGALVGFINGAYTSITAVYYFDSSYTAAMGTSSTGTLTAVSKTDAELKELAETLGDGFKASVSGYPLLAWETEAVEHTHSFAWTLNAEGTAFEGVCECGETASAAIYNSGDATIGFSSVEGNNVSFTVSADESLIVIAVSDGGAALLTAVDGVYTAEMAEGVTIITRKLGDVDGSGSIDAADAGSLLLAGAESLALDAVSVFASGVSGENFAAKASTILRYNVGLIAQLF